MHKSKNSFFWLTIFILFCISVYVLKSVLMPFVTGIILGYLFDPIATKFEKWGLNRTLATCLVLFLIIIILVPSLILLISVIDEQLLKLISIIPQYTQSIIHKLQPFLQNIQESSYNISSDKLKEAISNNTANALKLISKLLKNIVSGSFALFNVLSLLLITPVVTFYILRDWKKIITKADSLLPKNSQASIRKQAKEIDQTLAGFLRGQSSICLILGGYYSIGLYTIGVELGLLIGFIAGIISFIPYIGTISGFIVSIAVAFAQFDTLTPVLQVVGLFAVGQFMEGNFLTPKLVGESIGLHPVWVMFALLAGGVLMGFFGMLIAIPVAAIIGVLIRHAIDNYKNSNVYLGQ